MCTVNTFTSFYASIIIFSVLGFMAHAKEVTVDQVVKGGPGLAFLVFPEVVLQLDPNWLWSILFFTMLLALGFDSQFCILESLICGLVDNWPKFLRPRRLQFTACMVVFMFVLGIPQITNGGVYLFQLMDFYCASGMSLLWCTFFQTIAICWIYGADKVYDNIHHMIGFRINRMWYWCWMVISPAFMVVRSLVKSQKCFVYFCIQNFSPLFQSIFVFYFVKYTPIKYAETYHYPWWGEVLGFMISFSSMIWVPGTKRIHAVFGYDFVLLPFLSLQPTPSTTLRRRRAPWRRSSGRGSSPPSRCAPTPSPPRSRRAAAPTAAPTPPQSSTCPTCPRRSSWTSSRT